MPITRKQFELGIDNTAKDWMKRLHSSLAEHETEAFSPRELANKFGVQWETPQGVSTKEAQLLRYALDKLAEVGWLEKRYVRDDWYYAYSRAWDEEEIV